VDWISKARLGFIRAEHLGWLSGWLMVLPNALLALYYARRGNPEVVYTSQIGDGHISIPLCIGVFALQRSMKIPVIFETGIFLLIGVACVHFFFIAFFGRLPRWMAVVLCLTYVVFLYKGLLK
jgi:cation:H+ antiporter